MNIQSLLEKMTELSSLNEQTKTHHGSEKPKKPTNPVQDPDLSSPIAGGPRPKHKPEKLEPLKSEELDEEKKETKTGIVHKAEPGGYGRKLDTDEEGEEKKEKKPEVKRGRGRPKKGADSDTGVVPQYTGAKALQSFMVGNLPKGGLPGKPGKKHKLKDWIEAVENKILSEMGLKNPIPIISGGQAQQATLTSTSTKPGDADVLKAAAAILKSGGGQIQMSPQAGAQAGQQAPQAKPGQSGVTAGATQTSTQPLREKELDEVAPPGMEDWINDRKADFKKRYGDRWKKVLYATAWKRSKADDSDNKFAWKGGTLDDKQLFTADKILATSAARTGTNLELAPTQSASRNFRGTYYGRKPSDPTQYHNTDNIQAPDWQFNENTTQNSSALNEGYALEDILSKHPYEHKMCQEGWGMDESLYEDLCEYYFKEGRIPRSVWHGPLEELRQHVEKCYEEDTKIITEEPVEEIAPAIAAVGGTLARGLASAGGAIAGNAISNALAPDEEQATESALEQSLRQNVEEMENTMDNYDARMESWERQLNTLLTEGVTITTSTGQKGVGDSVSVSATDGDAQSLMKLLQNSGLLSGRTGMSDQHDGANAAVVVEPVSSDEVLGSLAGHDEHDSGDTEMSFLKRMLGSRGSCGDDSMSSEESHDYSSEDDEESEKVDEEYTEEGNAYTGARQAAIKAGKDTFTVRGKTHKVTGDTSDEEKMKESMHEEKCEHCGNLKEDNHVCEESHNDDQNELIPGKFYVVGSEDRWGGNPKAVAGPFDDEGEAEYEKAEYSQGGREKVAVAKWTGNDWDFDYMMEQNVTEGVNEDLYITPQWKKYSTDDEFTDALYHFFDLVDPTAKYPETPEYYLDIIQNPSDAASRGEAKFARKLKGKLDKVMATGKFKDPRKAILALAKQMRDSHYEQGVAEGTGVIADDDHEMNQIKKIRARLLKIPGFAKKVSDENSQLKLARLVFDEMKRDMSFDKALVLAQRKFMSEGTGVTDYAPKSQGGTREELLEKYKKTGDFKDAAAARKAGATQKELQDASKDLTEWANSPAGGSEDEQFQTEIEYITKMISGGLNGMKRDQTVLPSTQVKTKL